MGNQELSALEALWQGFPHSLLDDAGAGETNQRDVIRRCMAGRGYSVLN